MISAATQPDFSQLAADLAAKARAMAEAAAEAAAMAARQDPTRWRRADLLWPLFTKG